MYSVMLTCIYTRTHTYTHIHTIHTYTHTHIYTHTHSLMQSRASNWGDLMKSKIFRVTNVDAMTKVDGY